MITRIALWAAVMIIAAWAGAVGGQLTFSACAAQAEWEGRH